MYKKVDYPEKQCVGCGEMFKPRQARSRFCSCNCSAKTKAREWRKANPDEAKVKDKGRDHANIRRKYTNVCRGCGVAYHPKRSDTTYCSRECAFKNNSNKKIWGDYCEVVAAKYTAVSLIGCIVCGKQRYGKVSALAICSDQCRITRIEKNRQDRQRAVVHECPGCGVPYCRINGERFRLCPDCFDRKKAVHRKKGRKAHNHRRRARKLGVASEIFDPLVVLDRDKWKCQGCGCDTPKDLRGTSEDNAPELDHIIPLSRGGEHTVVNTQCLCRVCNLFKSDKTMGEYMQWNQ